MPYVPLLPGGERGMNAYVPELIAPAPMSLARALNIPPALPLWPPVSPCSAPCSAGYKVETKS